MTRERIIYDFEDVLRKSYNIEEEKSGWYRFSKGRGNFQGGIKGEKFQIALELFIIDATAQAHLDKDLKKASKALETCHVEKQGSSVWVITSAPLTDITPEAIREMIENCLSAARTRTVWNLETQHKKAPLRF